MTKIKVCYMIYSLSRGGAEGQLIELLRRLDRNRFDPTVIVWEDGNLQRVQGLVAAVRVLGLERGASGLGSRREYRAALALKRLAACLSEIRPHILHAILSGPCILAAVARVTRLVPCVIHSRRTLVDAYRQPGDRLKTLADSVATRLSDRVIGNCEAIIYELVTLDGVPPSRVQLIRNGVDTARFSPHTAGSLRDELGWSDENFVFGIVANFVPYKGHLDFVQLAARIHAIHPNTRFLLAGEDRGAMQQVKDAIEHAGLGPYTGLLPGMEHPERAFATLDVYLCLSSTEALSNSVLEAMSSGVPVIATDVGGNREAIADGTTGFLVPGHTLDALANRACELIGNPDLLRRLSTNARRHVEQRFPMDRMVRDYEEVYARLVGDQSKGVIAR